MRTPRFLLIRTAGAALLPLSLASPAFACPVCASDTGAEVRAGLFDGEFGANAAKVLLPFPVTLALLVALATTSGWASHNTREEPTDDAA